MNDEHESNEARLAWILGGISLGALAMYLADPDRGRQRRAVAGETMRSVVSRTGDALNVAARDIGSRAQGWRSQAADALSRSRAQLDDVVLAERVRQQIGRVCARPAEINIDMQQGRAILSGTVAPHERPLVLEAARSVEGVAKVDDWMQTRADSVPHTAAAGNGNALAGMSDEWTPALRAIVMAGGAALGLYGLAMVARRFGDLPFGQGAAGERVMVDRVIHIAAPPEKVFDLWSKYENFPRFMSNVQEVRDLGGGRSHWVVKGPAGTSVEWDAQITDSRRGEVLAWRSENGSTVDNSGQVRFTPDGSGTRAYVHLAYTPPAGAAGQAIASLFGKDPGQQMDEDLARMKAFIESGKTPPDAAQSAQGSPATLH